VIDALEALGIPYMLVGSFASNVYGVPRGTQDADFVVQFGDRSPAEIAARLGASFKLDLQSSFETITMTLRHVLSVVGTGFAIELFHLTDDPHDQERFRRRRRVRLLGREASLPTVEDIVVTKVRWATTGRRPKDREDALNVILVQGDRIDWDYVNAWCDKHGSRAVLEEIRKSIPPV
jgi:hypothetical protein